MFAALLLPQFCLQAALRHREHGWHASIAVADSASDQGRILEMTPAAAEAGVEPGLTSPQAQARCSELKLLSRAEAQEAVLSAVLLEVALSLSPNVEASGPGVCTADLRTVRVADWEIWAEAIVGRFRSQELRVQIGVARNPDVALFAARRAAPLLLVQDAAKFLCDLPLAEAAPTPELLTVLGSWGICTLGALARLPQADVIAKLGPEAGMLWRRANGRQERLLRLARLPELYEERFDFEHEIETTEPLLFLLRRFIETLAERISAGGRVIARMMLTLPLEGGDRYERDFTIPSPTADVDVCYRTLTTHLDALRLEGRPVGVRLAVEPVDPCNDQLRLFESAMRDPNRFGETLARLAALVGNDNVGVAQSADSHRPDSFRLQPPAFHRLTLSAEAEVASEPAVGLPLHRYRPPVPAEVQVVRDNPVFVTSAAARGVIADALGPFRVSGEWWGSEEWSAEEWDIELAVGGLFRLSRFRDAWLVEGCYDGERLR